MPVLIKGVRLDSVSIGRDEATGRPKFTGSYSLMSEQDISLATQSFNGYNDIKIEGSPETVELLNKFVRGLKNDLERMLGMTLEEAKV